MGIGGDVLGIVIGIAGSLAFLLLLFSVKPRLQLTWVRIPVSGAGAAEHWMAQPGLSGDEPSPPEPATAGSAGTCEAHYRVAVRNLGLGRVVELEARLWLIVRYGDAPPTRRPIALTPDTLLELPGKWREACRTAHERDDLKVGGTLYRFRLPCEVSAASLAGRPGYFLFQIWSKHGFTNFGRLHLIRIIEKDGCLLDDNDYAQSGWTPRFAPVASAVAAIGGFAARLRKHQHRFEPQGAYVLAEPGSGGPRTVVPLLCACGEVDTRSVPGLKNLGQALRELQDFSAAP